MTTGSNGWSLHRRLLLRSATISLILAIPFLILRPDHYENGVERPSLSLPGLFPSTWDTSSSCPDPYHDDLIPVDRELHSGSQTCYSASSATPAFYVEICASGRTCNAFSVRIRRTDQQECRRMEEMPVPASTAERQEWLRKERGPDSFMLRTSGAQRWGSEISVYEGDCTYRFDVSLNSGGPVWIELVWEYTEYLHFDEIHSGWPKNVFTPLLAEPLRLDICDTSCPTYHAPRLRNPEEERAWSLPSAGVIAKNELPACDPDHDSVGIWLPRHPMDSIHPPTPVIPARQGHDPLMGISEYVTPSCRWKHAGTQFVEDRSGCTAKPAKALFVGDSHGRYIMLHFKHRLDGEQTYYAVDDSGPYAAAGPYHFTYDKLQINFQWNTLEEYKRWDKDYIGNHDHILLSYGAWPALHGKDVEYYLQHLETMMKLINDAQAKDDPQNLKTRHNVFLFQAAYPPHLTGKRVEKGDVRTNPKLRYWRDRTISSGLMEKYGWRMIDQFERSMPVVLEILSGDGVHLSPGPAHAGLVDEAIAKMGLCMGD